MLRITNTLAGFQPNSGVGPTSAPATSELGKPMMAAPKGLPTSGPLKGLQAQVTRHAAMQTFSDPNFWRARAANRIGISTHDDPNVQRYLTQLQQTPPSHPGLKVLGAAGGLSLISNALTS